MSALIRKKEKGPEEKEREEFETAAFNRRFMSSIQPVKPGSFGAVGMPLGMPVDCPMKADFLARAAGGNYIEESLNYAWWGWCAARKVPR